MGLKQQFAGSIEPRSESWKSAGPADRLAFYREAGERIRAAKRAELARGIGANGRRMAPRKRPRPDGADGPVMIPHEVASRTNRLMASFAWVGGLTLFWRSGHSRAQPKPWGTILGFHAEGKVRGAPARDVRLSRRGTNAVRREMARWWDARARAEGKGPPPPPPPPTPPPAPPPGPRPRGKHLDVDGRPFSKAQLELIARYPPIRPFLRGEARPARPKPGGKPRP